MITAWKHTLLSLDWFKMHWFESVERDKVWNTQWRAANVSNNSNEDVENFDTQFQRMRYFVYTVGKNVNMIKSKNREQATLTNNSRAAANAGWYRTPFNLAFTPFFVLSFLFQLFTIIKLNWSISNEYTRQYTYTHEFRKFNLKRKIRKKINKERMVLLTRMDGVDFLLIDKRKQLVFWLMRSNVRQILLIVVIDFRCVVCCVVTQLIEFQADDKKKTSVWMSCQTQYCWSSAANNRKTFTFVKFKLIEFPLILFYPFLHKVAIFAFSSAYSTITIYNREQQTTWSAQSPVYMSYFMYRTLTFFLLSTAFFRWFFDGFICMICFFYL